MSSDSLFKCVSKGTVSHLFHIYLSETKDKSERQHGGDVEQNKCPRKNKGGSKRAVELPV